MFLSFCVFISMLLRVVSCVWALSFVRTCPPIFFVSFDSLMCLLRHTQIHTQCYKSLGKWANCRAAAEQVLAVSPADAVAKNMIDEAAAHIIAPAVDASSTATPSSSENTAPTGSPNVVRTGSPALKSSTAGDEEGSVSDQLKALAAMMGQTSISE